MYIDVNNLSIYNFDILCYFCRMKKVQHNKKPKYPFNNKSILKFISETQNQADNSKTVSFSLQLFNKDSKESSTSLGALDDIDDAEDKAISSSKKR